MPVYTISLDNAAELGAFRFSADFDGTDFRLHFQHNSREDAWYFDLLDLDGDPLRSGIKVVSNFPLIRLFVEHSRPAGELLSLDTRNTPADPGLADLNVSSIFGYADAEAVEEATA